MEGTEGQSLVRDNRAEMRTQVSVDSTRLGLGQRLGHCLDFLEFLGGAGSLPSGLVSRGRDEKRACPIC